MQIDGIKAIGDKVYRIYSNVNNRRRTKIVRGTLAQAKRELKALQVEMGDPKYVDSSTSPVVRDALDRFLEVQKERMLNPKENLGEGEYDNKERHARQFCGVKIDGITVGEMKVSRITEALCEDIIKDLSLTRKNKTVSKLVTNIHMAFDFFVRKQLCQLNPLAGIKISTKGEDKPHRAITFEEIDKVLDHSEEKYRLLIDFCAHTGMRFGEQAALEWSDIDFDEEVVHVRRAIKKGKSKRIGDPKTKAGERCIFLADHLIPLLKKWKLQQPLKQRKNNLVFPDRDGGCAKSDDWRETGVKKACLRAEIEEMTFKDLRNFYASVLIFSSDFNDATTTEFIGHSEMSFTKKHYARWFADKKRDTEIKKKLNLAFRR